MKLSKRLVQCSLVAVAVPALLALPVMPASARASSVPDPSHLLTIPTLGGSANEATAVNDEGIVVGWSWTKAGSVHAFAYDTSTGVLTDLGDLGGGDSSATAINDHGIVAGESSTAAGTTRAFRYDLATHVMTDLGALLPGASFSEARGINDSGVIVGDADYRPSTSEYPPPDRHAFRWDPATSAMTDLGEPGTNQGSAAQDINDSGVIVGWSGSDSTYWAPPALTPAVVDGPTSSAVAVNAAGLAVGGWQDISTGQYQPFTFDTATHTLTVVPIPAANDAWAAAIADDGTIVGSTDVRTNGDDLFLVDPGTTALRDLGRFGTDSMDATGINATHTVVGLYFKGPSERAFVLSTTELSAPVTPTTTVPSTTSSSTPASTTVASTAPPAAAPAAAVTANPTFTG